MTSLIAAEQLLCASCERVIQIGEPILYVEDEPIHEACEDAWWDGEAA